MRVLVDLCPLSESLLPVERSGQSDTTVRRKVAVPLGHRYRGTVVRHRAGVAGGAVEGLPIGPDR